MNLKVGPSLRSGRQRCRARARSFASLRMTRPTATRFAVQGVRSQALKGYRRALLPESVHVACPEAARRRRRHVGFGLALAPLLQQHRFRPRWMGDDPRPARQSTLREPRNRIQHPPRTDKRGPRADHLYVGTSKNRLPDDENTSSVWVGTRNPPSTGAIRVIRLIRYHRTVGHLLRCALHRCATAGAEVADPCADRRTHSRRDRHRWTGASLGAGVPS